MRTVLSISLACALAFAISCAPEKKQEPAVTGQPDFTVNFPDHNLGVAVRTALGKTEGDIYASDLARIERLDAKKRGIIELSGIEHMKNIRRLDLRGNNIRDIGPINSLKTLTYLDLSDNYITDISPLYGLSSLEELYIAGNDISTVSALSACKNLRVLDVSDNNIVSIQAVSEMSELDELHIDMNRIPDMSPLLENNKNGGLSEGDFVFMSGNPLDRDAVFVVIPTLEMKGVSVQN